MTIVISDPSIGNLSWKLPLKLERRAEQISRFLREETKLSEEEAVNAEKQYVTELQALIIQFMHVFVGVSIMGGEGSILATELLGDGLSTVARIARSMYDPDPR